MYDFQETIRKQGGLSVRTPPGKFLLFAWESQMPPRWEYTKTPPQTGGCSFFLIEKSSKTTFL
jgi:hypothetical protein